MQVRVLRWLCLATASVCAGAALGCTSVLPRASRVATSTAASEDATGQAKAALERLFVAWGRRDVQSFNTLVTPHMAVREGELPERIEVGPITPVSAALPSVPETGGPYEHRAFQATIKFWGPDLSVDPGVPLDWTFFVVRGADGRWLVDNWGY